jgi:hypothetical protein
MTDQDMEDMMNEVAKKIGPLTPSDDEMRASAKEWIDRADCFVLSCGSVESETIDGMFFFKKTLQDSLDPHEGYKIIINVVTTLVQNKPALFKEALELVAKDHLRKIMDDPAIKDLMKQLNQKLGNDPVDEDSTPPTP